MRSALTALERMPCGPRSTAYWRMSATSAAFGDGVGAEVRARVEGALRRVEEQAAAASLREHHLGRGAGDVLVRRAGSARASGGARRRRSAVCKQPRRRVARVRDDDVEPAEGGTDGRGERASHPSGLRHVGPDRRDARRSTASRARAARRLRAPLRRRSESTTCAPARGSARAVARPMPDAAPVTSAIRRASGAGAGGLLELRLLEAPVLDVEEIARATRARTCRCARRVVDHRRRCARRCRRRSPPPRASCRR